MFTQVYFRAEEILGFLSGFTESGPCSSEPRAATAESGEPGRGNNEKQSSEVDSEEPKS